jgi:hypothetical protein
VKAGVHALGFVAPLTSSAARAALDFMNTRKLKASTYSPYNPNRRTPRT